MSGATRHTEPIDVHLIAVREGATGPEVLLSRRAGAVYAAGCWHLPSGHLDGPYEDVVVALVRETREETGVRVDPDDVHAAVAVHHRAPGGSARVGFFFEVRRWSGTPKIMEPEVCDAMGWFPFDALPEPMVAYCRAGLDAYLAGARMAVHFQEPGDPIAYVPKADRLRLVRAAGSGGPLPGPAVEEFAERAVGRIAEWTDVSWPRANSQVWRVRGAAGGLWFVKVHQNAKFHARETAALRSWVPRLEGAGPRLVAADARLRTVVLTAVEGRSLHGAVLSPGQERHTFRAIGELAARIHAGPPPPLDPQAPPVDPYARLERHLEAARPHLAPGDEEYIRQVAEHARLLPPVEPVATHGDFQLRNLLLAEDGTLRVIDFERSESRPAVRDFVRILDAFDGREDLFEAFLEGYGRRLTEIEEAHLVAGAVLDAVSGIAFGTAAGDPELVERGRRTLARRHTAATTILTSPTAPDGGPAAPDGRLSASDGGSSR
ncbi:phosphotransferase [Streptomyces sp. NPDC033754]|uniref:phosphotransferase n=1 Tax=unclassified Streptomyces TaxID=2593676 RepID=UPI003400F13D